MPATPPTTLGRSARSASRIGHLAKSGEKVVVRTLPPTPSIAQYRTRRGWSQARLADESGVSRTEISAVETGRLVPSVAVALKLASALGEPVEALFGGAGPATSVPW